MLNKSILKVMCIFSLVTGACLGILPLIPALTGLAFFSVMFLCAPFVILKFKKLNLTGELQMTKCLSVGAISGFFAFLGFCIVYFPIAWILYLIFKINSFLWIKVMAANIGFLLPMVFLGALLSGLMNMFSAFLTVYIIEYLSSKKRS